MNELKLPICNPLIKGYLHHAFQFSVLGNYKHVEPWIYMNYIQLVSEIGNLETPVLFYLPDYRGYNWSILTPCFEYQVISRNFIVDNNLDFINIVRSSFQKGYYVYTYVNERYIPGTYAEEIQVNFNHGILLNGINDHSQQVFFWGYDKYRQYTERRVDYQQLLKAFYDNLYNYDHLENRVYLFKVREDRNFILTYELTPVIEQLIDLRDSKHGIRNIFDYHQNFRYIYGLNVYDSLITFLKAADQGGVNNITLIPLHILMEHKIIMIQRMHYIESLYSNIKLTSQIIEYTQIKVFFESLRNQILRCEMSKNQMLLKNIISKLHEIKEKEFTVLNGLIKKLSLVV